MVTIVVSPLTALIKDQIDQLSQKGIIAKSINHRVTQKEKEEIITDLQSEETSKTCLLYVTPELCTTDKFRNLIKNVMGKNRLACIVVDEAHCISMWGRDFRPAYKSLGDLRLITVNIPWIALTATSAENVKQDIITTLKFRDDFKTFKLPSFRLNLIYDVEFKNSDPNKVSPLYKKNHINIKISI